MSITSNVSLATAASHLFPKEGWAQQQQWLAAALVKPCFQHAFTSILNCVFLAIFTVTFFLQECRNCSPPPAKPADNHHHNRKEARSILHPILLDCCAYLFLINLAASVWETATGILIGWSSILVHSEVFAVLQTIGWFVIFLVSRSCNAQQQNRLKYLGLLQAWWILGFFASTLSILSGIFFSSKCKDHQFWDQPMWVAEIASFPAIMFLGTQALCSKMEIELEDCIFQEPLLSADNRQGDLSEREPITPYVTAGIFSLATLSWLSPLLSVGAKKHLELKDLPHLAPKSRAHIAYEEFQSSWEWLKQQNPSQAPSLVVALVLSLWVEGTWNALFALINVCATYVGPFLIDDFVNYLGGRRRFAHEGLILVSIFFIAKIIENLANRQWYLGSQILGLRMKAALMAFLFHKGLRLSNQSRRSHTSAEIINYMVVDVQKISDFTWSINHFWTLPVRIGLALAILSHVVGVAWVAALGAALLIMFINTPLTKLLEKLQAKVMAAKDERMKATSESLRNMRVLKLHAWDETYLAKIEDLRGKEFGWMWRHALVMASTVYTFWTAPILVSTATFVTCVGLGIPLSAGKILTALATCRILQDPLDVFPEFIANLAQTRVSVQRLWRFLQEPELPMDAVIHIPSCVDGGATKLDIVIEVREGNFSWDSLATDLTLTGVNLQVKRGVRVAVCGTVGSGKSSLLSCILGEIPKISGTVRVVGSTAYVAQSAWIQSGTVEDNIRFGSPMDHDRYSSVLEACALKKDLELFAFGDQTEIGERGINLSGGQKQRIQLARALYQNSSIYLLDDPFSAVDAHTGSHIFKECILKYLLSKTVVYVTHQVEFLSPADLILVLRGGEIVQAGNYDELLQTGTDFSTLVHAHHEAISGMGGITSSSSRNNLHWNTAESVSSHVLNGNAKAVDQDEVDEISSQVIESGQQQLQQFEVELTDPEAPKPQQLVTEEERERGTVNLGVYWSYLTAVYQGALIVIIVIMQVCFQVLQIAGNYWIAWASPTTSGGKSHISSRKLILVYMGLAFGSTIFVIIRSLLVELVGLLAAQKYFKGMVRCIFRAPMSFFDSTPTGRILNRSSSDQSDIDWEIQYKFVGLMVTTIQLLGTITVMSQVGWEVLLLFLPVFIACIFMQRYYMKSARELQRVKSIQQSPIIHHYGESITGAATIRGFGQEQRFMDTNINLCDKYMRPSFYTLATTQWLVFRMELLSTFIFASLMMLVVLLPPSNLYSGLIGLAVIYGLSLNIQQSQWVWCLCEVENTIIAVERVQQYMGIPSEAPLLIQESRPPWDWPTSGTIQLQDLQIQYAPNLPMVLHGITCTFYGGEKVGIVGRTGSGKSTLIQALFRMVEPVGGKIIIDRVDITTIGLHDLRARLSIIPQDPTLFEGNMRTNLDPLGEHSDAELWEALDKCKLGDAVRAKEKKLCSLVEEYGENWSVGQQQLVCLGRALLKSTRILVLDEATASVDSATDNIIQRTIRAEFNTCTVLTVAHRIPTVVDSDRVLVLSEGRVSEYDMPRRLLKDKSSCFAKLVAEYSERAGSSSSSGGASTAL